MLCLQAWEVSWVAIQSGILVMSDWFFSCTLFLFHWFLFSCFFLVTLFLSVIYHGCFINLLPTTDLTFLQSNLARRLHHAYPGFSKHPPTVEIQSTLLPQMRVQDRSDVVIGKASRGLLPQCSKTLLTRSWKFSPGWQIEHSNRKWDKCHDCFDFLLW